MGEISGGCSLAVNDFEHGADYTVGSKNEESDENGRHKGNHRAADQLFLRRPGNLAHLFAYFLQVIADACHVFPSCLMLYSF